MIIQRGGSFAEEGLYWDPVGGQRIDMVRAGTLPGDDDRVYVRISPVALLVIAPVFGMMYVMFLPLFGIGVFIVSWLVLIISSLARLAMTGIQVCGRIAGRSTFFHWNPTQSYFSGTRKKKQSGVQGRGRRGERG